VKFSVNSAPISPRIYLSDPNLPISEIAWLVGYQGVSAFSHGYKRWTGMNPKKMRGKLLASH